MDVDGLYDLPPDEFVGARDALAKELRGAGRREEAAEVAALRRPSAAAAVVNRLARARGGAMDELFAAGDALRTAQSGLLAGMGDREALRAAIAAQRDAVARLVGDGRALAGEHGDPPGPAVLEKVAETLQAAALDEDARALVRAGRLTRELRHVGLGFGEGTVPAAARRATKPKPTPKQKAEPKPKPTPQPDVAAKQLQRDATAARRRADTAARRVRTAQQRRDRAQQALDDADEALQAAQAEAAAAADEQARAEARLRGG